MKTSKLFHKISEHEGELITLSQLCKLLGEGGFAIILLILAAPMALPIPALGISTVLGIPMVLLSIQILLGFKYPRLGKWLGGKTLKVETVHNACLKLERFFKKLERFIKARIAIPARIMAAFFFIFAISIMLPIPFSNTIPSMAMVLGTLGMLESDGILSLISIIIGCIGVALTLAIIIFGVEILQSIFG